MRLVDIQCEVERAVEDLNKNKRGYLGIEQVKQRIIKVKNTIEGIQKKYPNVIINPHYIYLHYYTRRRIGIQVTVKTAGSDKEIEIQKALGTFQTGGFPIFITVCTLHHKTNISKLRRWAEEEVNITIGIEYYTASVQGNRG